MAEENNLDKPLKVLVYEADGIIGQILIPRLVMNGFLVTAIIRDKKNIPSEWDYLRKRDKNKLRIFEGEMKNKEDIKMVLSGQEEVIDLTGLFCTDAELNQFLENKNYLNFLKHLKEYKDIAYVWPRLKYITKEDKKEDKTEYFSKIDELENLIKESNLRYRIVIHPPIIGYGIPFFDNIINYLINNNKVILPSWSDKQIQFIYIADLLVSFMEILNRPFEWAYSVELANLFEISFKNFLEKTSIFLEKENVFSESRFQNKKESVKKIVKNVTRRFGKNNGSKGKDSLLTDSLILNAIYEDILKDWRLVKNADLFFGDIFHKPAELEKILVDYFANII